MYDPPALFVKLQASLPANWLAAYDIELALVLGVVGGDLSSITELSNRLIEDAAENRNLPVRRGKVVPPKDAKILTSAMLEACCAARRSPPERLIQLNDILLGVDVHSRAASRAPEKRIKAFLLLMENPEVGVREIARRLRVSVSTASTWREEIHNLQRQARNARRNGN